MSIRVVLACNGKEGIFDCRQATPVGEVETAVEARRVAAKDGWGTRVVHVGTLSGGTVLDYCPSCKKKVAK